MSHTCHRESLCIGHVNPSLVVALHVVPMILATPLLRLLPRRAEAKLKYRLPVLHCLHRIRYQRMTVFHLLLIMRILRMIEKLTGFSDPESVVTCVQKLRARDIS